MSTAFFEDSSTPQLVIQGLQGQVSLRGEQGFPLLGACRVLEMPGARAIFHDHLFESLPVLTASAIFFPYKFMASPLFAA